MKKLIFSLVVFIFGIGQLIASPRQNLLTETFRNVEGGIEGTDAIDQTKFDNPSGWTFTDAYAGPECVIIKKGGSITTPVIPELTGNVAYSFDGETWFDPNGKNEPDWDNMKPHKLTVVGKGELYNDEYDTMSSHMGADVIYDADETTRLTFTASYDIMLRNVSIYYAANLNADTFGSDMTEYSRESGEYFTPFDLTLKKSTAPLAFDDGLHNILVYTTDGTDPVRNSKRYDGTPIHISSTTTVKTATIFGDGYMYQDKPRIYTFPTSETPNKPENTFEITVTKPGNLKSQLLDLDADVIEGIVLKGKINGTDLGYLGGGEGRTASLSYLDMSDVTFEYDETPYRTVVDAPVGMGTTYVYNYILGPENKTVGVGGNPSLLQYNVYRNNLAAAFIKHNTLKSVILPTFITSLGERMFELCRELTFVKFPEGLTSVGPQAFYFCDNLKLYDFPTTFEVIGGGAFVGTKLGNVRLDKKVEIGESAFSASTIVKLDLPVPPDSIFYNTFSNCFNLEEVNIGEGLKYIDMEAFRNCYKLNKVNFPLSLEEIGSGAFSDCPFVKDITPEGGIRYIGRIAYQLADNSLSEYTVKPGTVTLAPMLFAFTGATTFNLPESIEKICEEAFAVTQITSMPDLPSLKVIKPQAFRNCTKLARVTIPESVEFIGHNVFQDCNALWSVTYNAINAEVEGRLSPRDLERITIGDKVRRLPAGLYTGNTNVTEIILPRSVEILDPNVFEDCVNLEYIRLSDNITTISDHAFYNCSSLRDIHWPANLKTIGASAFRDCSSLKTISLPEGVQSVGEGAFGYIGSVENLYVASTIEEFGYGCFVFDSASTPITITATAKTPQDIEWNWHYIGTPTIKVPAASLTAYQNNPNWNGSLNGKTNLIIPIEGITASEEKTETSFDTGIDSDTDLGDTVIGDVYLTLGEEDGYDETDGAIVLNSSMDEEYVEAIGGMAPGESDLANRFNGLVVQVPAGSGTVTINCVTIGTKRVSVKIGDDEPLYYTKDSKGDITIDYNVSEDTFVYIYASDPEAQQLSMRRAKASAPATGNSVKIYSIGVNPESAGIEDVDVDNEELSPITEYYRLDGTRVETPSTPGIYVARHANGKSIKILVK